MNGASYINLGYNFLQVVVNSIEEMEKQSNANVIFSYSYDSDEQGWLDYEKKTRWNDNNIGIPILFNFFHGVELVLKGLIINNAGDPNKGHKLNLLLEELENRLFPKDEKLIIHFKNIIFDKELLSFFKENETKMNEYHLLLKYPKPVKGIMYKYKSVRGLGEDGINFYVNIKSLAKGVKENIIIHNKSRYCNLNIGPAN